MQQQVATHEDFVREVRTIAIDRALAVGTIDETEAARLRSAKLVYGIGNGSYRGICHYGAWANGHGPVDLIEIAATGEESWVQLAGTTIHETAHVLAEMGAGHGPQWKSAAERLGLRKAKAAGMVYSLAALDPVVREQVAALAQRLVDGNPSFRSGGFMGLGLGLTLRTLGGCTAGTGTRGGKSRGAGSGSRLLKVECGTCGYIARVTRKWLDEVGAPFCGHEGHGRMVEAAPKS